MCVLHFLGWQFFYTFNCYDYFVTTRYSYNSRIDQPIINAHIQTVVQDDSMASLPSHAHAKHTGRAMAPVNLNGKPAETSVRAKITAKNINI